MILTQEYSRIANATARAWLVSPDGKAYNCGHDHEECFGIQELRDLNNKHDLDHIVEDLIEKGFVKVGSFVDESYAYLFGDRFNDKILRACQEILYGLGFKDTMFVEIMIGDVDDYREGNYSEKHAISYKIFKKFESLRDLNYYTSR